MKFRITRTSTFLNDPEPRPYALAVKESDGYWYINIETVLGISTLVNVEGRVVINRIEKDDFPPNSPVPSTELEIEIYDDWRE